MINYKLILDVKQHISVRGSFFQSDLIRSDLFRLVISKE